MATNTEPDRPTTTTGRRLLWFVLLWAASVAGMFALVYLLRQVFAAILSV